MNWKKRKLVIAITAIATIGALYAFVGPRHYHHNYHHSHWQQDDCYSETDKAEQPDNSQKLDVQ